MAEYGWVLATDAAPNPRTKVKNMATKRKRKRRSSKRRKPASRAKKRSSSRSKRKSYAKKRNPTRKRRSYKRKRNTYKRKRNPTGMKFGGMAIGDIGAFVAGLAVTEFASQNVFGAKYRYGYLGGLLKFGLAYALAQGLKMAKVLKPSQAKALELAGVAHGAVAVASSLVAMVPGQLKLAKPLVGERMYRPVVGERMYRRQLAGPAATVRPTHLAGGRRTALGTTLPRHLQKVSRG